MSRYSSTAARAGRYTSPGADANYGAGVGINACLFRRHPSSSLGTVVDGKMKDARVPSPVVNNRKSVGKSPVGSIHEKDTPTRFRHICLI
jgi:hypothetical protein